MGRKKESNVGVRKYGTKNNYCLKDLNEALDKIKLRKMTLSDAAKFYKIPKSTIKYKLKGQHSKPFGKPIALSESEENIFINHIIALADLRIPLSMHDVRFIIKKYLNNEGKTIKVFKHNMPGWEWGKNFLDRHSSIKQYIGHNHSIKRAQINKEMIENFFEHLNTHMMDVLPENLYSFDETGFHDNPKKPTLLFRRCCRNPDIIKNATKSCFTTVFCGNAVGEFLPPFIMYKAKQKWSNWLVGAPAGTRMSVTKSGWFNVETFEEWFQSLVLPVLKAKPGKKVLLGDSLSMHISVKTLQLCEENNIKFICLIPNSTQLLQPLNMFYFSSLRNKWKSVLSDWRNTRHGKTSFALPKYVFAALLKKTLDLGADTARPNMIAGFKATGLYPCDVSVILKKLSTSTKPIDDIRESVGESFKGYIDEIKNCDLGLKQTQGFRISVVAGKSVSVDDILKLIGRWQESKNKPRASTKKRGRPLGSKNRQAKNSNKNRYEKENKYIENYLNDLTGEVDLYCIINYEGTLFPGRIIEANHPNYKISLMEKAEVGWVWPSSAQVSSVNNINIIRVLDDTSIQNKNGYFFVEDDCLAMEWGD